MPAKDDRALPMMARVDHEEGVHASCVCGGLGCGRLLKCAKPLIQRTQVRLVAILSASTEVSDCQTDSTEE
jgi:hypothetical protein